MRIRLHGGPLDGYEIALSRKAERAQRKHGQMRKLTIFGPDGKAEVYAMDMDGRMVYEGSECPSPH